MLIFKSVSWKNFLSTGNVPNELILDKTSSTLIVGKNGEGKSTMLDALTFALFGKPFRDINKNQLINSINKKNCVVEVKFELNSHKYRVVRGIKPNIFEIYCDEELINQDAALKDYQKVLEQQILRLNYKTFTQVIILGSSSFVPFMQLPSGQRREVIEDILDIRVFSFMNQILKEKVAKTKENLNAIETSIRIITEQARAQQKIIDSLQSSKDANTKAIQDKIEANKVQVQEKLDNISAISAKIEQLSASLPDSETFKKSLELIKTNWSKYEILLDQIEDQMSFFNGNTCPACKQNIEHDHKDTILAELAATKEEYIKNMATITAAQDKLTEQMKATQLLTREITDLSISHSVEVNAVMMLNTANAELEKDMVVQEETVDISSEKTRLKELATGALEKNNIKAELSKQKNIEDIAAILLKDTGIKTAIIREYLPVMNKLINKYLTAMDFFVHFELDESFNEIIKSRHRDEFTYASFSEGEKMRIDLAILFTWRQIAKMKNSVNTNLLILDEVFDSSLDTAGTDFFLSIMNTFGENSNVFVISHKGDQLLDKFSSTIKFEKRNEFSVISDVQ